jgi:colanic acid/amylovoran biosynthesis glycosyltransferase
MGSSAWNAAISLGSIGRKTKCIDRIQIDESADGGPTIMMVAYLVNQYPHVSHTFIRREIAALERRGLTINRFSIRPAPKDLVDSADVDECKKTHVILADGLVRLLAAAVMLLFTRPVAWSSALAAAIRLGRRSDRGVLRHFVYFLEACRLQRLTGGIHHLHAHFGTNSATVAILCRMLGGPKFSFTVHGPEEFDKPESLSLDEKIQHSDFVIAISSFGRSQLCRWSRFQDWPKIQVVRCGLDASFLNQETTPVPNTNQVVCIGRLSEQKGQLLLLEAVRCLAKSGENLQLMLAGDGPLRSAIESYIQKHSLSSFVRITGWVSGAQVKQLIRESRAMVLPSFAEGLPVVLMEALALGRPVITTYIAGIPELVRPCENGWLVPAGDVDALVHALTELLQSPLDELSIKGYNGAQAVRRMHNIDIEAERLAKLFAGSVE